MKLEDVYEIEDGHVFEVLNSRFRHRIMRELLEPKPVKTLAGNLGVPVTRLYYHVNQLADAGLIRVVEERKVGAIVEKVYQTTARTFSPGSKLLESGADPADMARIATAVVLDPARLDSEVFLTRHFETGASKTDPGTLARGQARISKAKVERLTDQIHQLLEEMEDDDEAEEGSCDFSLSVVFVPLTGPE